MGILSTGISAVIAGGTGFWSGFGKVMLELEVVPVPISVPGSKEIFMLEGEPEGLRRVVAMDLRLWAWERDEELDTERGMRGLGALRKVEVGVDVSVVGR